MREFAIVGMLPRRLHRVGWELLADFAEHLTQGGDLACQGSDCFFPPTTVFLLAV
jgi:hypothetical protein